MNRYRVGILRGGSNVHYATSMRTGAFVLEYIDRNLFNPIDIVIARNGEWIVDGRTRLPEHVLSTLDIVFNALHGTFGEDGGIQRLLERYGVAYTGSKAFGSAMSLNKVHTKNFLKHTGIKTPQHVQVSQDSIQDIGRIADKITDTFGPQYIIKPVTGGGSVGTMSVKNPAMLKQALHDALGVHDEVMVEVKIPGREATCGVIEKFRDKSIYVLPSVEVTLPKNVDYQTAETKQREKNSDFCPSHFDSGVKSEIERLAASAHKELGLSQYSRSDFIVADDGIYFLEVNALPQLSKNSLFSKSLASVGVRYTDFITHVLTDALKVIQR
jgi:D-alanine-D-alanine ligase